MNVTKITRLHVVKYYHSVVIEVSPLFSALYKGLSVKNIEKKRGSSESIFKRRI